MIARGEWIGYGVIAALGAALAFVVHFKAENDYAVAVEHYRQGAHQDAAAVAARLEMDFRLVYQGIRTIANLPSVRDIDRHAKNLSIDAYHSINEIYKNMITNVSVSEVYIVPVTLDPEAVDPETKEAEVPIIMFDGSEKFPGETKPEEEAKDPDKPEEVEIYEYRLLHEHNNWLKTHFGTSGAVSNDTPPMITGEEVITCDNAEFIKTRLDDDRKGAVLSVPFYAAKGELKGTISAIIRTNILRSLVHDANFALVNPDYKYAILPSTQGQALLSKDVADAVSDTSLLYSEVIPIEVNDPRSHWSVWAGFPNSKFTDSADAKAVGAFEMAGYGAALLVVLLGSLIFYLNQSSRKRIETNNAELERKLQERTDEILRASEAQAEVREQAEAEALEIRKNAILEMAATVERETVKSVKEIEDKASVVDLAANDMSKIATNVSVDTQSVSAASEEALTNAQTLSAAAEQLAMASQQIAVQVRNTTEVTRHAVTSGESAIGTLQSLTDAIAKISEVTKLIGAIAGQTNLLALNATIESARAGEAGRGFAVVAAEVKSLAHQTAQSTQDIERQITGIQSFAKAAVLAIDEVGARIHEIDTAATAIAQAVEQQGTSTREIAENVRQSAIAAREVSSRMHGVSSGAQQVDGQAKGVRVAIGEVTEKIAVLQKLLVRTVRSSTEDANRRASPRYAVAVKSEILDRRDQRFDSELIDISATGAHLLCQLDMHPGDTGTLKLAGLSIGLPFVVRGSHSKGLQVEFQLAGGSTETYQIWLRGCVERLELKQAS